MKKLFECEKVYHVYNRANGKENLFKTDENFRYFLRKYVEYIFPVAETLAYCLMPNHFHLLLRIRSEHELLSQYHFLKKERKQNPKLLSENDIFDFHKFIMLQFQHFLNGYAQALQ
jgi:REP element-mobilizing transposase RayT